MTPIKLISRLFLFCFVSSSAFAGYFELSFNGSYFKRNNGKINGAFSNTIIQSMGGGLGYHLSENISLELSYKNSKTMDVFNQDIPSIVNPVTTTRTSNLDNISLNVVLEMGGKKDAFRPYIRGGAGYMINSTSVKGSTLNPSTNQNIDVKLGNDSKSKSISAEGGVGAKIYISNSTALDFSYTVYASELDQPEIFLHYAVAGGLRFIF